MSFFFSSTHSPLIIFLFSLNYHIVLLLFKSHAQNLSFWLMNRKVNVKFHPRRRSGISQREPIKYLRFNFFYSDLVLF